MLYQQFSLYIDPLISFVRLIEKKSKVFIPSILGQMIINPLKKKQPLDIVYR